MRHVNDWSQDRILKRLRLEVTSREFTEQYQMLMIREPALARFGPPEGLIGALHDPRGASLDEKDELLHALVRTVQTRLELRTCAQTILALGMWPGLEHAYYELLPMSRRVQDLFEEIYWAFLEEVVSRSLVRCARGPRVVRERRAPSMAASTAFLLLLHAIGRLEATLTDLCRLKDDSRP